MANAEAVNYIKRQLHTGYTQDEIRNAMLEAGWKEKDIEQAFFIIGGEAHPVKPQKAEKPQEAPKEKAGQQKPIMKKYHEEPASDFNFEPLRPDGEPSVKEYHSPYKTPVKNQSGFEKVLEYDPGPHKLPEPGKPIGGGDKTKSHNFMNKIRFGGIASIVGGILLIVNMVMVEYLSMTDMMMMLYGELVIASFITADIIQMVSPVTGVMAILLGAFVMLKPRLDIYIGTGMSLIGLFAILLGNGYVIGGVVCVAGGILTIMRK